MAKELPSPETLRKLLHADFEHGILIWKKRPIEYFKDSKKGQSASSYMIAWNKKHFGKMALATKSYQGYVGAIFGTNVLSSRVIWAIKTGEWPRAFIGHKNKDIYDDRIENLFETCRKETQKRMLLSKSNSSGYCGIDFNANRNKWRSRIRVNGTEIHLGRFADKREAILARSNANLEYGFDRFHGLTKEEVGEIVDYEAS